MSTLTVTPSKISNGIWKGIVTSKGNDVPQVTVHHLAAPVENINLAQNTEQGHWVLEVPIPIEAIADGVQTFVVSDATDGEKLCHFSLIAGEVLGDDIRTEMELLRAELDMLKRAFRRHCVETT